MNLQASLASGKEGMEFTVISVVGTLLIGWVIGRDIRLQRLEESVWYILSAFSVHFRQLHIQIHISLSPGCVFLLYTLPSIAEPKPMGRR